MNEQYIFQKCIFEKNVQYWNFHNFLMKTTHLKYLGKKSGKNDDSLELLIIWPIFSLYFCTSVQLRTFILPVPFLSSCIKSYCLLMSKIQRKGKSFSYCFFFNILWYNRLFTKRLVLFLYHRIEYFSSRNKCYSCF